MASTRKFAPLARDAMAYVLAGGRGSRLMELTDKRAKPAVYFAGKTRIIDFALSNALNSGIRRMGVATQYKAHSLIRHLQRGWNFLRDERNESFDILPASQRVSEDRWYMGTADAVFQNIDIIASYEPRYMVILAGDHIYKMDYELMLQQHVDTGADVTVGCLEVPRMEAAGFGVMHVDEADRIIKFVEKPKDPPGMPDKPDMALASMGIYVFETKFLFEQLRRDAADPESSRDFGKDIIPYIVKHGKAWAHRFTRSCVRSEHEQEAYWRDVGTVDAYWEANIDLTDVVPALDLYDREWPIWTYAELTPPAKFVHDEEGRRGTGHQLAGFRRLHRFGRGLAPHAALHRRQGQFLRLSRRGGGAALCAGRPRRAAQARGHRSRCRNPGRPGGRRRSCPRRGALPAHRVGHLSYHPADDRRAGGDAMIEVLAVASEYYPLVKTGGLADVAGALPAALKPHGIATRTLIPGYPEVMQHLVRAASRFMNLPISLAVRRASSRSGDLIVLDAPHLYGRDGNPYLGPDGKDWPDNWRRFAALGLAAGEIAGGGIAQFKPQDRSCA